MITISRVTVRTRLQNVYHLRVASCTLDSVGHSLGNVHHLEICGCTTSSTLKGLERVTGSLILEYCPKLTSLEGLENIPEISIRGCPSIIDFTGLGHHQKLTVRGKSCSPFSLVFETMLKEFKKEQKHSTLFARIEHLYFHSENNECIW
jgi:hypothetical protein